MNDYRPQVAVVTGASRGAGKGIALALGGIGMTVYVTGRSEQEGSQTLKGNVLPGTVYSTADAITDAGGKGVPVICDHSDDEQVEALFQRIDEEQGQLDILVNNATMIHENLIDPGGFWEKPLALAGILDVGLRSSYVASYYAAPIMIKGKRGLITFTSSFGSVCYMHGPAYGAQKAGIDKFAADMAVDLEDHNVAAVSLWLGPQRTERTEIVLQHGDEQYDDFMAQAETPQFNGRIIYALACDPKLPNRSGQTFVTAELAQEYGITEEDGRVPMSYREMLGEPRIPHPARVI